MDPYIREFQHNHIQTHVINNNSELKVITSNENNTFNS